MKMVLIALSTILLTGCLCTSKKSQPATAPCIISQNTQYQIVMPDNYSNKGVETHLTNAVKVLQKSFAETLGMKVEIVKEKDKTAAKAIFIGNTEAIKAIGINPAAFENYNCVIAERDGNIFLAGNDRHRYGKDIVTNNSYAYILGSIKAMVIFMEDYMQTRFLMPGEVGTDYAKLPEVKLPAGMTRFITPRLIFATGRHHTPLYSYSNNNYGAGTFRTYGGHSYYDACPEKTYGKTNPEYFALHGGKRNPKDNHLCISNPEVQELIYKEMLKQLDAGAEYVQLAQTDGYRPCECEKCKAFGNTDDEGEKLWILHRSLAQRLLKDRPGKSAHIISYGPTKMPPKSFNSFPDNVIIELCSYSQDIFDAWSKVHVKQGFTVYIYNWGWYQKVGFTPKTSPDSCAAQVRLFVKNNVRGIYRCGFGELFGLEGPSYYVYGKMLDNPDYTAENIANEFYTRAFGKASAPMRTFYTNLYDRVEALYVRQSMFAFMSNKSGLPNNPRIILGAIYTPDLLEVMEKNLARAEALADTPKIKTRLALVRTEFNYVKNLGTVIGLYNAYRLKPTKTNFLQLADAVDARNALIDSLFTEKGRIKMMPEWWEILLFGGPTKQVLKENGRLSAPLSAPFTWNTKLLREKGILPGLSGKSMSVPSVNTAVGTDFNSGAWAKAKWEEVNGIQLNDVMRKTRFKAVYDKNNIYFALETEIEPGTEYTPCGHDGPCWGQDCMELTIDPFGSRQKYFHFIFNPAKESFYEAAYGLITDALDPLYNKSDASWNGKWTYTTTVNAGKWSALVTIPFATLSVDTPQPGTRWTWNVGRESYNKTPNGKSNLELSLWSPNLETMSFHEKEAFGEVVFE